MTPLALADPVWLLAGLAIVALAEVLRRRRRPEPALPFAFRRCLEGLPRTWRERARPWLPRLRLAILAVVALAAAGPSIAWRAREETRQGVDVLVALDASSSMTTVLPGAFASTRFDAARAAAVELARARPDDRVGLVVFAKYPRLVCPLTWDHELFEELIGAASPVEGGTDEDGTAIGIALADGADRLAGAAERARVLVLVTDGVNNVTTISPEEGVRLCQEDGVRVHTIALGPSAPRSRFGTGTPPPDVELLERIAAATGGSAFHAEDRAMLEDACRSIDALEHSAITLTSGLRAAPVASAVLAAALLAWVALGAVDQLLARSLP